MLPVCSTSPGRGSWVHVSKAVRGSGIVTGSRWQAGHFASYILLSLVFAFGQAVGNDRLDPNCVTANAYLGADVAGYFARLPTFEEGVRALQPEDKTVMNKALARFEPTLSIYSFANFWAWTEQHDFRVFRYGDAILMEARSAPPSTYHSLLEPLGVPHERRAEIIRAFLAEHPVAPDGKPYVFRHLSKETAHGLEAAPEVLARPVEGKAEFVYDSASLGTLGDLPKRRNSVRGFFKQFPDKGDRPRSQFVAIHELPQEERDALIPKLHQFLTDWTVDRRGNERLDFAEEVLGTRRMLDNFDELGMFGGAILVDGKVVSFTLGKPVNKSTLIVYSEKAMDNVAGQKAPGYQAINQRFALHMLKKSLSESSGEGAQRALRRVRLWEEMEDLQTLSVPEAIRYLNGTMNIGKTVDSVMTGKSFAEAMGRWKQQGWKPEDVATNEEAALTWETLKVGAVLQAIGGLNKRGIPDEKLSESKNPDAVQLAKAIEGLRDFRLLHANQALAATTGHLQYINRQEHGGDGGHQGAKERYAPKWMEESWLIQSRQQPPVSVDVYGDEQ